MSSNNPVYGMIWTYNTYYGFVHMLEIAFVREVGMCVCVCVCASTPNLLKTIHVK